jgi:hypothetical protein
MLIVPSESSCLELFIALRECKRIEFSILSALFLSKDAPLESLWDLGVCLDAGEVVLGLDHGVSAGGGLEPLSTLVGSTAEVELGEVKELASLGNVLLVVRLGLLLVLITDLGVLGRSQTSRNVRTRTDSSRLELLHRIQRERVREIHKTN